MEKLSIAMLRSFTMLRSFASLRKASQGNTCRLGLYDFGLLCDRDGQGKVELHFVKILHLVQVLRFVKILRFAQDDKAGQYMQAWPV